MCYTESVSKEAYNVSLTIRVGTREYLRHFFVKANDSEDAVVRATWLMPHLPDSDPMHSESDGQRLEVVKSSVRTDAFYPAWCWVEGAMVFRQMHPA